MATFQAVQIHLVTLAQCAARITMAADMAARSVERGSIGVEVAAAKIIASQASTLAAKAAHQAHGAIGVTRDYRLQQLSRRLWAWRHEYGIAAYWRRHLGQHVFDAGPDQLFPLITS